MEERRIKEKAGKARQGSASCRIGWWRYLWALVYLFAPNLNGQAAPLRSATEDQMRSAFLFQVAQYVTWPLTKLGDTIRFCVLGDDPLAFHLESTLRGRSIQGRAVVVSRISSADQIAGCQIAYLAMSRRRTQDLMARWRYPPVLLVGEAEGFAKQGGMVNIRIEAGRLSLEINLNSCRRAGLDVRSQLLRLARIVSAEGDTP